MWLFWSALGSKSGKKLFETGQTIMKVGPFRSLFAPILVTRVSQIDYKATILVKNESLWCPKAVSIKTIILIEWKMPLEP